MIVDMRCPKCNLPVIFKEEVITTNYFSFGGDSCQHCKTKVFFRATGGDIPNQWHFSTKLVEVGLGDMIEYQGLNGVKVMIYAREITDRSIRDGNVACCRSQVTRVVHTAKQLKEGHDRYMKSIRGTAKK